MTQKQQDFLYWPGAIRVGKWKLHRYGNKRFALYDLEEDIAETTNLVGQKPELVSRYSEFFGVARR